MLIIVPYRDRAEHLQHFASVMAAHEVVVVEQADDKPFNRAKLLNIGVLETMQSYFVLHDVDMIPVKVDYSPAQGVTQLASSKIQKHGYLGGATMFDLTTFFTAGGYHNDYFHRAEDNEMMFNLTRLGIHVHYAPGIFTTLPHERNGPEFDPTLWHKAQKKRGRQDQLAVCEYKVVSDVQDKLYRHIKVIL